MGSVIGAAGGGYILQTYGSNYLFRGAGSLLTITLILVRSAEYLNNTCVCTRAHHKNKRKGGHQLFSRSDEDSPEDQVSLSLDNSSEMSDSDHVHVHAHHDTSTSIDSLEQIALKEI